MQPGSKERVRIDIAKCPFSVNCVAERRDGRVYIHCVFDGALTALIHFATSETRKNIRDKFFFKRNKAVELMIDYTDLMNLHGLRPKWTYMDL